MVFSVLVFFFEICVKKFQPIIRTTLYTIFFNGFGFLKLKLPRKKNRNYQKKMPKNRFLACFHIMSKKKLKKKFKFSKKLLRSFCEKLPII